MNHWAVYVVAEAADFARVCRALSAWRKLLQGEKESEGERNERKAWYRCDLSVNKLVVIITLLANTEME